VWHFIVLPTVTMAALVVATRYLDRLILPDLDPASHDLYQVARTVLISLVMASLIAWLAISYRGQYEDRLRARNEALESTRAFLARIIEGSAEAIVTLDPELRVTSWNAAAERIYGRSAANMIGRGVDLLLPSPEAAHHERRQVHDVVRRGESVRGYQSEHVGEDGEPVTVRMSVSPLHDADGRYEGSTAIIRDVSSLIEMEQRLREQDRLAVVGRLAAQVAHEIKNPLAGIRGACEIMMGRLADTRMHEIAEEVVRQIDRLNRSVEDLLQFSRPTRTAQVPTDLHELIESVLGMVLRDARAGSLQVERAYAEAVPAIPLDAAQIQQVLYNVLLNACQAMNYSGRLSVATYLRDSSIVVRVRDSGPGIPEGVGESIFEPFYTTRTEGTGLGLAIVRKIVQAHRGTIEAGSAPGGGAEFLIALPLSEPTPPSPPGSTSPEGAPGQTPRTA